MDPKTERERELQDAAAEPAAAAGDHAGGQAGVSPDAQAGERTGGSTGDDAPDGDDQVSEAENLGGDPNAPIAPDQATAGYPDSESGSADEGEAGPNARNGSQDDRPTPFEKGESTDDGREAGKGSHERQDG